MLNQVHIFHNNIFFLTRQNHEKMIKVLQFFKIIWQKYYINIWYKGIDAAHHQVEPKTMVKIN